MRFSVFDCVSLRPRKCLMVPGLVCDERVLLPRVDKEKSDSVIVR